MSIQLPAFSGFWVLAGLLIGMVAIVSYLKGALYQGSGRFLKFTLCWGVFIALVGLWPPLVEGVGYAHPLGSLSAGIALGFLALIAGGLLAGLLCIIIILWGLIVENIPPRTETDLWS